MSQLPDRPDTDQLRRQARELHRAAADGDARALGRLRRFSDKVTLSAAQLAIARLEKAVLAASAEAAEATIDDLGSAAFMVDLASMKHETQYTRLFRS